MIIKVLGLINFLHYSKDKQKIGQEINLEFLSNYLWIFYLDYYLVQFIQIK